MATIREVIDFVGDDKIKAAAAYRVELLSKKPRATLLKHLADVSQPSVEEAGPRYVARRTMVFDAQRYKPGDVVPCGQAKLVESLVRSGYVDEVA